MQPASSPSTFATYLGSLDHLNRQKIAMKGKTRASNRSSVDKEGKKEAAINQSIRKFNCGDLLWVELHGSSWWPALVVDDSTLNAIHKPRERRKGEVLVRLYGSYKYVFIDPVSSHLEFENTLNKHSGSHNAILKESLKQDLCQLNFGASKKKEMKMKGKGGAADSSQGRTAKQKQNVISKNGTGKVPSSVRSSSRELDANSPAIRSKETSSGTKENGGRKRKKEEAQKKSKSNGTKSATEERNNTKEKKMEPQNNISSSRKQEQDMKSKKPKTDGAVSSRTSLGRSSASATPKPSVKRGNSLSDQSEKGNNKKQKQSGAQKNLRPNSPNLKLSRRQGNANQGHSLSKKMGSLRTKMQTQNTVQRKLGKSDAGKISQANKDAARMNNAKPSKQEIVSPTSEESVKEPSARKLKVMRILGLIAPAGSPFIRNGSSSAD